MSPVKTYAPDFLIKVWGTDIRRDLTVDVLSVSVTDTANQADSFSFTVRDRNPTPGGFAGGTTLEWLDSGLFDEGNEVEIRMGYVDNLSFVFVGDITAVSPSFPESGVPTLTVRGFSRYHLLQRTKRTKPFESSTVSGIAKEIAGIMGLKPEVDPVEFEHPYDANANLPYAEILKQRAAPINYEVAVKYVEKAGHTLFFQKPCYYKKNPGPVMELRWGRDLRSFSPSLSTYDMATEVEVRASITSLGEGKTPLTRRAVAGAERFRMGDRTGPEIALSIFGDNAVLYPVHEVHNPAEAKEVAIAQLEMKSLDFISGQASIIGTPSLRARIMIKLTDLGRRFSGPYYVTSVTHTIDSSGYRTDFQVKRNARNDPV
jgi:phage protein D